MSRRTRSRSHATFIQLVLSAAFVCLLVYLWKRSGCLGFSQSFFCQTLTPRYFLKELQVDSSAHDFSSLMDLSNFSFLMNNLVCNDTTDLMLLVLVHSGPYNEAKRSTIRNTWGQTLGDNSKLLFLLGMPNSTVIQRRLREENATHGDLVQGNFMDTYRNLTYKHVMGLKWTKYFCPRAKYLLKTDDDVFVNSPGFLFYVERNVPQSNLMRCLPVYDGLVKRSWRSKWRVKFSEYPFRTYPAYCQGLGILYSPDVVSTIYAKAQRAKYFWLEDVFITGILRSSSNITPSSFGNLVLDHEGFYELLKRGELKEFPFILGPWNLNGENIKRLWGIVSEYGFIMKKPLPSAG